MRSTLYREGGVERRYACEAAGLSRGWGSTLLTPAAVCCVQQCQLIAHGSCNKEFLWCCAACLLHTACLINEQAVM